MCSAALETFGTVSAPIQHVKSEVGCRPSEPLDSLIGGVLVNQHSVGGQNTVCTLVFYSLCSIIPCFHVLQSWHEISCYCVRSG